MHRGLTLWLICLTLIATRVMGLHLHACAGLEPGRDHVQSHFADNGLLFGEHHSEDDGDDVELKVAAALAAKLSAKLVDPGTALPAVFLFLEVPRTLLAVLSPRAPPNGTCHACLSSVAAIARPTSSLPELNRCAGECR